MRSIPPDSDGDEGESQPPAPTDEDFLFYLYRGSELLMQDRVMEAKGELERALERKPQDAKGQDLLAGVYFRLGVYPRAIEIWLRLVRAYPRDSTLRVNTALALLKTGQPADALEHVQAALGLEPEHERAWGYLGLIEWRLGHFREAHEAFLRAGQVQMARRMEEAMRAQHESRARGAGAESTELRTAADEAIAQIEAEGLSVAADTRSHERGEGAWRAVEPARERVPKSQPPRAPLPIDAPLSLAGLVASYAPTLPRGSELVVGASGEMIANVDGAVYARLGTLRAVRGEVQRELVPRTSRAGRAEGVLGGASAIHRCSGTFAAVFGPPPRGRFVATTLDDDVLYVREDRLAAFESRLAFTSARLPLAGLEIDLVQLEGRGTVVLLVDRGFAALSVASGESVRVALDALVGWTGRLFPAPFAAASDASLPPLELRGEGAVLVV